MFLWWSLALAEPLTLDAALNEAVGANLELRQARLSLEASGATLRAAGGLFDPTATAAVVVSGASDDPATTSYAVGVSQPLPTGASISADVYRALPGRSGTTEGIQESHTLGVTVEQPLLAGAGWIGAGAGWTAARYAHQLAELSFRSAREELVIEVAGAYWGLVAAREYAVLARSGQRIAEDQLAQTRERFDEGFAGSGDVLQVERSVGVARQALLRATFSEADARALLARRLGRGLTAAGELDPVDQPPEGTPPVALGEAVQHALAGNVAWLRAQVSLDSAQLSLRAARNEALPALGVYGSVGFDLTLPDEKSWSTGATLSVPLTWRIPLARLQAAAAEYTSAQLQAEAARYDLEMAVASAVRAVATAEATAGLAADTLKAAEAALAADQEQFREGRASARDVVRSLEELQDARLSRLAALIEQQRATLELGRVQGDL